MFLHLPGAGTTRWIRSLGLSVLCQVGGALCFATGEGLRAEGLTLSGVSEGARILLPSATSTTQLTVSATSDDSENPGEILFHLEWQGSVIQTRSAAPAAPVTFEGLRPGKYFLTAQRSGRTGDVSFDIAPPVFRPGNDAWSQASVITRGVLAQGSNLGATLEATEPALSSNQAGQTVWWSWVAPIDGWSTITTRGSGFDTVLGLFIGTAPATLQPIAVNDDVGLETFSQITFQHTANTTYSIAVDGVIAAIPEAPSTASGAIQLQVVEGTPPRISVLSPVDGATHLVLGNAATTNLVLAASIDGGNGNVRLHSLLEGEAGFRRVTEQPEPFQWTEPAIPVGEYDCLFYGSDTRGLIGVARAGFSVVSQQPEIEISQFRPGKTTGIPLQVRGFPGRPFRLESSSNLTQWQAEWRWMHFAGIERVTDTNLPAAGTKAYRAIAE